MERCSLVCTSPKYGRVDLQKIEIVIVDRQESERQVASASLREILIKRSEAVSHEEWSELLKSCAVRVMWTRFG